MTRARFLLVEIAALLLVSGAAGAQQRTLYWRAFDVGARLDRAGRLHIHERQTMVSSGAWNGGKRIFRLRRGETLVLERLVRIDARGEVHPLRPGRRGAAMAESPPRTRGRPLRKCSPG